MYTVSRPPDKPIVYNPASSAYTKRRVYDVRNTVAIVPAKYTPMYIRVLIHT